MSAARNILIVGGGTAGWITAGYLARALGLHRTPRSPDAPVITLIESPEIGIIGVGEGTFPTIKATLQALGIDEADFMRESSATFKQGIRFANWEKDPQAGGAHHYFHPFENPHGVNGATLALYWHLLDPAKRPPFAAALSMQQRTAEARRGPKRPGDGAYKGLLQYAYHLDAHKFARFLAAHGRALGVRHLTGTVDGVELDDHGNIKQVHSAEHGDLRADFYFDCTGMRAELIGKALGVPFKPVGDVLFTDRAVACQVPYPEPDTPIESYTVSTAHDAGWTWDIGLDSRRGIGYVYSSRHTSDEAAYEELARYVGPAITSLSPRKIKIRAGHYETFWKNNCVAVGLAAGFLEPLEASAIVLIELSAKLIAEQMPACREVMDIIAARFNETTGYRWGRIIDFLKLHYVLTKRTDSAFWTDNVDPTTVPERLQNLLKLWKYQSPWYFDEFDRLEEVFPAASYQYVLYGMGFRTEVMPEDNLHTEKMARRIFNETLSRTRTLRQQLPKNRDLIRKIHEFGLQPI